MPANKIQVPQKEGRVQRVVTLYIRPKFLFGLVCLKDIASEISLFKCNFANLIHAAVLFLERKGFLLATLLFFF